jgi:hypothetical protein
VLLSAAVQPTKHECLLPGSHLQLGGAPPDSPQNNNNDLMQAENVEEVRVQHLPSGQERKLQVLPWTPTSCQIHIYLLLQVLPYFIAV